MKVRARQTGTQIETLLKGQKGTIHYQPAIDVDLRVGGAYRVEMLTPDDRRPVAVGTYQEITRPERLVFTWAWEDEADEAHTGQTLVTVEFQVHGEETEVVITHTGFANEEGCKGHGEGWRSCLDCLDVLLSG